MMPDDAKYTVRVLADHGHVGETAPRGIVLLDGEYNDLVTRSPDAQRDENCIIIEGMKFYPLSAVKDRIPYTVYERANAGIPAMWWKPLE